MRKDAPTSGRAHAPHPATMAQAKAPHAATLVRQNAPHPAVRAHRKEAHPPVQRMIAPSNQHIGAAQKASVGLLVMEFNNGRIGVGTGTLITSHHVLTCAHNCVESSHNDMLTGVVAVKVTFYPGFVPQQKLTGLGQIPKRQPAFPVDLCVYFKEYETIRRNGDIAVFRLTDECYPAKESSDQEIKFPGVAPKNALLKAPSQWGGTDAGLYGYQVDQLIKITEFNARNHLLVYKTETPDGSSGSPIFRGKVIWGVHTCINNYTFAVGIFDEIRAFILRAVLVQREHNAPFVQSCM